MTVPLCVSGNQAHFVHCYLHPQCLVHGKCIRGKLGESPKSFLHTWQLSLISLAQFLSSNFYGPKSRIRIFLGEEISGEVSHYTKNTALEPDHLGLNFYHLLAS